MQEWVIGMKMGVWWFNFLLTIVYLGALFGCYAFDPHNQALAGVVIFIYVCVLLGGNMFGKFLEEV